MGLPRTRGLDEFASQSDSGSVRQSGRPRAFQYARTRLYAGQRTSESRYHPGSALSSSRERLGDLCLSSRQ